MTSRVIDVVTLRRLADAAPNDVPERVVVPPTMHFCRCLGPATCTVCAPPSSERARRTASDAAAQSYATEAMRAMPQLLAIAEAALRFERGSVVDEDELREVLRQALFYFEHAHGGSTVHAAFRTEFRVAHEALHKEWTAAVGTAGYDKQVWRAKLDALFVAWRIRATAIGIPNHESLLMPTEST